MSNPISFSPVATQRASEAIFEQIRSTIVSGELKPGDRLPSERAMMTMFQRSRPTIREALRMLENAGLVQINAGCEGAVITLPTQHAVEQPLENLLRLSSISNAELLEFRKITEVFTIEWASARRTQEDLDAMRKCLEDAERDLDDRESFFQRDMEFHHLIAQASKNSLSNIVGSVIHQVVMGVYLDVFHQKSPDQAEEMCHAILASHRKLYAAIEKQNPVDARLLMTDHIVKFNDEFLLPQER